MRAEQLERASHLAAERGVVIDILPGTYRLTLCTDATIERKFVDIRLADQCNICLLDKAIRELTGP